MSESDVFDLVVVGAGPAGYSACFRASELGMKTALVEKGTRLGGVCLNVGCIPSKALLESSERFFALRHGLADHGIAVEGVKLDLAAMMARKDSVVRDLEEGLRKRLEGLGVRIFHGMARLAAAGVVRVSPGGSDAGEGEPGASFDLGAKHVLLATGGEPVGLPFLPFDGRFVLTSTDVLSLQEVPERMTVIGAGAVGLELGSVWNRLGAKVTVVELLPGVAAGMDGQVSRALSRFLSAEGMEFRVGTRVVGANLADGVARLDLEREGRSESLESDVVLVAVGRRPLTRGLGLQEAGVAVDGRSGQVVVDEFWRTSAPGVLAVGDLVAGPMLAHKASAEGAAAVERLAGKPGEVNYDSIPSIIYTSPEAAGVGLTEEQLKARGAHYRSGVFPMAGVGRARAAGDTRGFVKVLAQASSDRVLGIHMVGDRVSEIAGECVAVLDRGMTAGELARMAHAHPTFTEAIMESASAAHPWR